MLPTFIPCFNRPIEALNQASGRVARGCLTFLLDLLALLVFAFESIRRPIPANLAYRERGRLRVDRHKRLQIRVASQVRPYR